MFKTFARRAVIAAAISAVAVGTMGFQSKDRNDRRLRIINDTGVTLTHFYVYPHGRSAWLEDSFGREVLASGASLTISLNDGSGDCIYDFRARFADGIVLARHNINVCRITEYRFTAG